MQIPLLAVNHNPEAAKSKCSACSKSDGDLTVEDTTYYNFSSDCQGRERSLEGESCRFFSPSFCPTPQNMNLGG